MSRSHDIDDRPDRIELRDLADRPSRSELADGCDGSPWCECVDCERVGPGGFFAFEGDGR